MGFRRLLGFMPSAAAEIQAIVSGLEMCSRLNIGNINMYSDADNAIFLMKGVPPDHLFSREITYARDQLFTNTLVKLYYARREANQLADFLARNAHSGSSVLTLITEEPANCKDLILANKQWIA